MTVAPSSTVAGLDWGVRRCIGTIEIRKSWMRNGYYWSTPKSAAFIAAVIIIALILGLLLRKVIELR